jgi:RNA polymerase sigma-70 factor (ECF subfamily)
MSPGPDGREELYRTLVANHADELFRLGYRLTGSSDLAEEIVQETYCEAWRGIAKLRDPARARVWLLQILRFRHAHWLRDSARRPLIVPGGLEPAADVPAEAGAAGAVDEQGLSTDIQDALDDLVGPYKVPFLLVFLHGLSCREVADLLDMPLGTVLSRLHRARQFLKRRLASGGAQRGTAGGGRVIPLRRGGGAS